MTGGRENQPETTPLGFPNPSRSYDETRRGVRFWGYDRAFEVSFFIEEGALLKVGQASGMDGAGLLSTFDVNRDQICAAAARIYARRRRSAHVFSYTLTHADI